MTDIEIRIPLALTTAQVIRASPTKINEAEARELAQELHAVIEAVRVGYPAHHIPGAGPIDFVLADLLDAVRRTALGFWPWDRDRAVGEESCFLMERLTDIDQGFLYDRYLVLCDHINGTNFARESEPAVPN
jgi:hypothetical protein